MQARTENLQAQLAAATAQLQDLQARQQQLEARNASLESFASTALGPDPLGPPVVCQHTLLSAQTLPAVCIFIGPSA
jgi:multidrug efflux pump subunit AcrA (membrane-fusion protein)